MSQTFVQESRPLDALFDSTYANSASAVRPPLAASSTAAAVAGGKRHHHHHHYRPRVPHAALIPAEVLLAPQPRVDPTIPDAVDDRRTVDAGIQTVYRESESQTNPFTPEFIVDPTKPTPEVLMLEGIKYKDGPKANSEAEVRMLELARRRNAIEAALPPTTDEASVVLRRMVLEELESDEFKARERDIDAFQEERLHALAVALAERDRAETFNSEVRVDLLRQRTRETFDKKRTATTQKRLSTLRKLDTARANALPARLMQGASSKGDTIQMMSKPSSTKFVALRREGASMDDKSAKFSIGRVVAAPESPEALRNFAMATSWSTRHAKIPQPRLAPERPRNTPAARTEKKLAMSLQILKKTINGASSQAYQEGTGAPSGDIGWQGKAAERPAWTQPQPALPATPRVPESANEGPQREIDAAICLLQSLLRGRAAQNEMFLGKQARLKLIKELRTSTEDAGDLRAAASRTAGFDTISGVAVASVLSTAG